MATVGSFKLRSKNRIPGVIVDNTVCIINDAGVRFF